MAFFMSLLSNLRSLLVKQGKVSDRFELMQKAISGTMSRFYMARDKQTGQIVGLKLLDTEKTAAVEARSRGLNKPSEGQIGMAITHPNIVKTLEFGSIGDGQQFILLEYLDGPGLNSLIIGRGKVLDGKRVRLIREAAEAVAAVHAAGYIHRDVCPRNFVVARDGSWIKLIDFGLTVPSTPPFMQPGNRTGTPNYMAPEIVRRKKTDQRVDVFAFGVTAYEICTFELPWPRGTTGRAAMNHDTQEPVDIRNYRPKINPVLAEAIMQCLHANPDLRPPSMDKFLRNLEKVEHEDAT